MKKQSEKGFNLPDELVPEILIKLPVKSLLRFRCVCKSWNSLITSSSFILSHLHHNRISSKYTLLFNRTVYEPNYEEIYSLHDAGNEQFHEIERLDLPYESLIIVGSVNGLICLFSIEIDAPFSMLWNPSIKKCLILPRDSDKESPTLVCRNKSCFGFGYDAGSDDFKVVRISRFFRILDDDHAVHETHAEVFSLRTRSWRTFDSSYSNGDHTGRSINLGNKVYSFSRGSPKLGYYIMCFDLSAEVFTEKIPCPEALEHRSFGNFPKLTIFRDCLAVISECDEKKYHIWIMSDEAGAKSFQKLASLDISGNVSSLYFVGFVTKEKLLVVGDGSLILSLSVEDVQVVKYVPSGPQSRPICGHSYKESLALLKEGNHLPSSEDSGYYSELSCESNSEYTWDWESIL